MDPQRKAGALAFIRAHIKREGFPPSMREIGEAIGVNSTSYVRGLLMALDDEGAIAYVPGKNRGIRLLDGTCPACGQCKPA